MRFKPVDAKFCLQDLEIVGAGVPVSHEDEEFDALQKADGPG